MISFPDRQNISLKEKISQPKATYPLSHVSKKG